LPAMTFDTTPVLPRGFRCASRNVGLKPEAKDLALFVSEVDCVAAAVFKTWWALLAGTFLLVALVARKTIQYFLLSRNLRMSFLFSLFLYLNKIPLIWGQLTLLLQRSRGTAPSRRPGIRA